MEYKATLTKEKSLHYVSDADMVRFIETNSDMDWNKVCDYIKDVGITSDEGLAYWSKEYLLKYPKEDEASKWVSAFFKAHPWIERMMIVFDD